MFALVLPIIVALWALVANASTGSVRHFRDIGISSGYGAAFGYVQVPSAFSVNKYLQADTAPSDVNLKKKLLSSVAISNGYGTAYGYSSTPTIAVDKNIQSIAISSGYGGAYGYDLQGFVNVNNVMKSDVVIRNDSAESIELQRNEVKVKSDIKHDIAISSGYGGAYSYASTLSGIDINKDLPSNGISSSPGVAFGYSPTSTVSVNDVKPQKLEIKQVVKEGKVISLPLLVYSYLPGYSGYGNRINSYSGYSRYPIDASYGFAYANGWL